MGMLANRLRKSFKHLQKWARREEITCFRVYDRDIPEEPVTVDWYEGRALVQCAQKRTEDREAWLAEVEAEVREGLEPEQLYLKDRRPGGQYQAEGFRSHEFPVHEGGLKFLVNLTDYHDTGLFLDHRQTRARVRQRAAGKRVLNLFCYTGSFSVYAAAGGARETVSVDLSATYLEWAERNFRLNDLSLESNRLERADILAWLDGAHGLFDLIVCDPPTFSNSKKMSEHFDVNVHHPRLIQDCLDRLTPDGELFFSTNSQNFKLLFEAEELTERSVPPDFRNRRQHRLWRVTRGARPAPGR